MCEIAAAIFKGCGKGGKTVPSFLHAFHGPAFPRPLQVSTDTVANTVQNPRTAARVHLTMMTLPKERSAGALHIALRAARENETRWMEMSPEFSDGGERMEQWASTAKLRRLEVERLETLLAEVENSSPGPTLR
jgi:hypothetical protein